MLAEESSYFRLGATPLPEDWPCFCPALEEDADVVVNGPGGGAEEHHEESKSSSTKGEQTDAVEDEEDKRSATFFLHGCAAAMIMAVG